MRGFMRAIGLGGLLKNSATTTARQSAKRRSGRAAMGTLMPVDDVSLVVPDQRASVRMSRARSRESSVYERPQFLFFCGSDNSGVAATRRTGYQNVAASTNEFSFDKADVQARASTKSTKIETPMISHRMPVFFAPNQVLLPNFE